MHSDWHHPQLNRLSSHRNSSIDHHHAIESNFQDAGGTCQGQNQLRPMVSSCIRASTRHRPPLCTSIQVHASAVPREAYANHFLSMNLVLPREGISSPRTTTLRSDGRLSSPSPTVTRDCDCVTIRKDAEKRQEEELPLKSTRQRDWKVYCCCQVLSRFLSEKTFFLFTDYHFVFVWCIVMLTDESGSHRADMKVRKTGAYHRENGEELAPRTGMFAARRAQRGFGPNIKKHSHIEHVDNLNFARWPFFRARNRDQLEQAHTIRRSHWTLQMRRCSHSDGESRVLRPKNASTIMEDHSAPAIVAHNNHHSNQKLILPLESSEKNELGNNLFSITQRLVLRSGRARLRALSKMSTGQKVELTASVHFHTTGVECRGPQLRQQSQMIPVQHNLLPSMTITPTKHSFFVSTAHTKPRTLKIKCVP